MTDEKAMAAFWKRPSYAFNAPNPGMWAVKFANACNLAPTLDAFQKFEADNKQQINALDEDLYRNIVQPAITKAVGRLSQSPLES